RRQRQVAVPHRPSDQERSRRRPRRGRARQVRNRHLRAAIGRGRQQRPRPARDHRHRPGAQRQPLRPVRLSVTMRGPALFAAAAALALWAAPGAAAPPPPRWLFNDSHFHLTNYVQRGLTMRQYVAMMGTTVKRSTVFGIPLQQTWSYPNSGDYAPTYYLQTDASLYYYSFTDAMIATGYLSLPPEDRARLDPMITGFNPADMYAADHIKRVLQIFPGVFSGIGEFSIHKEFVSGKVAGETASLTDPALDRILDFAGEAGLVAIVHCDIDMPFTKGNQLPLYFAQMRDLLLRHPKTTIIWAHTGLGRVVQPIPAQAGTDSAQRPAGHLELIESLLADPR